MNTNQLDPLTKENAHRVSTVINIANPEWGSRAFEYQGQPLTDGRYSDVIGKGPNSKVLHDHEYRFWAVASYKD